MDQKLKHRLTGAVILVSVAVIFIPVILEGPDNEWAPLSHSIPEPPQLDYKARMNVPQPVEVPVAARRKKKMLQKPAEPVVKQAVVVDQKTGAADSVPEEAGIPAGWYVQVGSFTQKLNASGLGKRLELSGYETRLQKTTTETGHAWRVMVGPEKTRGVADKLRDKLARERQLKGIVVSSPS